MKEKEGRIEGSNQSDQGLTSPRMVPPGAESSIPCHLPQARLSIQATLVLPLGLDSVGAC